MQQRMHEAVILRDFVSGLKIGDCMAKHGELRLFVCALHIV